MRTFVLLIVVGTLQCACALESDIELTDGYVLFRHFGAVHAISKPNGEILVFGDVNQVEELGKFIVGERIEVKAPQAVSPGAKSQPLGYFIYDKEKDELAVGLSKSEYDEKLEVIRQRFN